MKMIFYSQANKTHFHNKQFAFSLILELRNGLLQTSVFLRACKIDDKKLFQNKL